uniref:Uncharacterized protein n=1 Tax=Arundo donax TaxID=35708 RepID=A0A0A9F918_ARUDO
MTITSTSQVLVIVKSLYPRVELEAIGEGFAAERSDEKTQELLKEVKGRSAALVENLEL